MSEVDAVTEAVAGAFMETHGTSYEDALELAHVALRAVYEALEREGPSEEMIWAGAGHVPGPFLMEENLKIARDVFKAMLRAAPKPPGAETRNPGADE